MHIGVLSPVSGGFYFGEILAGVVRQVTAVDGTVTLLQTLDAGRTGDDVLPAPPVDVPLGWRSIDGFIAVAGAADPAYLRALRAAGRPLVLAGTALDVDAPSVLTDNAQGIRSAVGHLAGHGHTRIAFVGNLSQSDAQERFDAYRTAMAELGLPVEDSLFVPSADHVQKGGREAAQAVALAEPRITAVVASTDRIALGLMAGLDSLGLQVPQDVAVVGFDDIQAGWRSNPPLATVNQHISELGARAAALLLEVLHGGQVPPQRHTTPSTFLPRGSCGCLPTPGRQGAHGEGAGLALVDSVLEHLAAVATREDRPHGRHTAGPGHGIDLARVDLDALDRVIEAGLDRLHRTPPSPETVERFTETVVARFGSIAQELTEAGLPGREVLDRCTTRTTVLLSRRGVATGVELTDRLSLSLVEQYDVGIGLLGDADTEPSDLQWLSRVSVPLGSLGLWDGPRSAGRLRLVGLHDPDGLLTGRIPATCSVEDFPPRALAEQADPLRGQACFVIPVRGASGDHGFLALIGAVDSTPGSGRATYNHWAALLGVALKQQRLLEEVRRSEERYSLAAAATEDGLWDWDVGQGTCFFSDRCLAMFGGAGAHDAGGGRTPGLEPWLSTVHPDDERRLREALARALVDRQPFEVEHRMRDAGGEHRWVLCRGLPVAGGPDGTAQRVVGSLADIDTRKELEEQLRRGALYDVVTGLPNRRLFLERLREAVEDARAGTGRGFAVVFLDLDGFKLVNDSLGHLQGDELLTVVAGRLVRDLRPVDTAARFGGDEFAVLLRGMPRDAVLAVVRRIQERIAEPMVLDGHDVCVSASVGIASSRTGYTDAEDVLRDADIAMYHAKGAERGTASLFEPAMHTRATGRLRAQSELRTALLEGQFEVHYQPLVALDGAVLTQFEALVRWRHPQRGVVLPGEFLSVMTDAGTIVALGQWVIDAVCEQIAQWHEAGKGPVEVSVNVSHAEFWSDRLLPTVRQALARHGVDAHCLVLEITESVIMSDPDAARSIMRSLQALGVRLHIDDFGTGHSSLHALRAFPVDALKIDQSFVQQLGIDAQTTELVRIIVAMGEVLGIHVVAEGVETTLQADTLRGMGCGTVQGWLYARALPGRDAAVLLGTRLAEDFDDLLDEAASMAACSPTSGND